MKKSNPARGTCETTSQVLLAGVSVVFIMVLQSLPHLLIGPSHMSWNNLERDIKLNLKKKHEKGKCSGLLVSVSDSLDKISRV